MQSNKAAKLKKKTFCPKSLKVFADHLDERGPEERTRNPPCKLQPPTISAASLVYRSLEIWTFIIYEDMTEYIKDQASIISAYFPVIVIIS